MADEEEGRSQQQFLIKLDHTAEVISVGDPSSRKKRDASPPRASMA